MPLSPNARTFKMIQHRVSPWLRLSLFWLCLATVLVLALMPIAPRTGIGWDKANHALAFAVLLGLGRWSYPGRIVPLLVALLAFGTLIEVLQSLTSYRTAEWADLLADAVGLGLGWLMTRLLRGSGTARATAAARVPPPG